MTRQQDRLEILKILYKEDVGLLPQGLDCKDLSNRMDRRIEEVRREVTYLEEKGYVTTKSREIRGRIFSTLQITARGIDVVEGRTEDGTIGRVEGDVVQIRVGNGARNLALGKEIEQLQESDTGLAPGERAIYALQQFLSYLEEGGKGRMNDREYKILKEKITELQKLLREIGLGF
jgi:predicted ArsR family transcriptional regulator